MLSLQLLLFFLHPKNPQKSGQQPSNLPNGEALQRQNDMSSYMMRNLGIILHYQILPFH